MKKQLFSLLLLISFSIVISAQTPAAQKIDEFGNVNCEGYLARMDNTFVSALNDPSSKIYVFVYEGYLTKPKYDSNGKSIGYESALPQMGLAKARIRSMKQYLKLKNMPQEKFVFVEAGFLEDFKVELWNVPDGATPPKPTPTLKRMKYRKGKPVGFCLGCC